MFLLSYILFIIPLPYYIFKPGSAEEIHPMVKVTQGDSPEQGAFLLTTVGVMDSNVFSYFWAKLFKEEIRPKTSVKQADETDQEYTQRQVYKMISSQSSAIQAAYNKLGIPYHIKDEGVMVLHVVKGMPAEKVLQVGDYLLEIDGLSLTDGEKLVNYLKTKKAGDTVKVTFRRGDQVKQETVSLAILPAASPAAGQPSEPPRVGIGFTFSQVQSVQADDEGKQVTIQAGEIGGPSAGLMFSLEIYNQLVPEDITKGYRVAGTGEIDELGHVGVIGGIQHKVVAADREGAEIFFAPKDLYPAAGQTFQPVLNTTDAKRQAEKIGTKMKVVSVGTMEEALDYLKNLPPKGSKG
ncbi:PDZ domain-containing protein [Paenibacillus sp. CC-CFT747]|nr:PDZ domain-containing protein [Paenibacillus sp. CC-CFT747]